MRRSECGRSGPAFSRSRRWGLLAAGFFVTFALLGLGTWAGADPRSTPPSHSITAPTPAARHGKLAAKRQAVARWQSRSVQVASGETIKRFDLAEPAGVILLLRIVVPHGARADVTGVIPQLAGVSISTPDRTIASETCQRRGAVDVCTQAEEACPMPAATWHFRLDKLAGPAGVVRLDFVVG